MNPTICRQCGKQFDPFQRGPESCGGYFRKPNPNVCYECDNDPNIGCPDCEQDALKWDEKAKLHDHLAEESRKRAEFCRHMAGEIRRGHFHDAHVKSPTPSNSPNAYQDGGANHTTATSTPGSGDSKEVAASISKSKLGRW